MLPSPSWALGVYKLRLSSFIRPVSPTEPWLSPPCPQNSGKNLQGQPVGGGDRREPRGGREASGPRSQAAEGQGGGAAASTAQPGQRRTRPGRAPLFLDLLQVRSGPDHCARIPACSALPAACVRAWPPFCDGAAGEVLCQARGVRGPADGLWEFLEVRGAPGTCPPTSGHQGGRAGALRAGAPGSSADRAAVLVTGPVWALGWALLHV